MARPAARVVVQARRYDGDQLMMCLQIDIASGTW